MQRILASVLAVLLLAGCKPPTPQQRLAQFRDSNAFADRYDAATAIAETSELVGLSREQFRAAIGTPDQSDAEFDIYMIGEQPPQLIPGSLVAFWFLHCRFDETNALHGCSVHGD